MGKKLSHSVTPAKRNAKKECTPITQLCTTPVPTLLGEKNDFILKKGGLTTHLITKDAEEPMLEGYRSLGMFNIKQTIRRLSVLWELNWKHGALFPG